MIYNYKKFLEKKVNKEDLSYVYDKYYSNIEYNIFIKIVKSDPTSTIDGELYLGKYSKWLLSLYKNKDLKVEDLYKVEDYVYLFDKQSVRNKLSFEKRNINYYKSLGELAKELDQFKSDEDILSKSVIKDKNFVKEFNNYNLFIPRTFDDSCILGKGTEWCTATEKTDQYYKQYHKSGRELLILISKTDSKEKYQFHFRTKQFMDKYDKRINIYEFLKINPDIDSWLKENVKDYKKINGNNNIDLYGKKLTTLEGQNIPEIVEGNFNCSDNKLTTLKGGPEKVEGDFYCSSNNLTTLEGSPEKVEGDFYCSSNNLTTLEGSPEKVEGDFSCSDNKLTSLKGSTEIVEGNFYCYFNKLTSLVGVPKKIEGNFDCSNNNLTSLIGAPEIVEGYFNCRNNKLTSLIGGPEKVEGSFNCSYNKLTSLIGSPKTVEGHFNCSKNNLTDKDIEWLKQNCDIKGKIIS